MIKYMEYSASLADDYGSVGQKCLMGLYKSSLSCSQSPLVGFLRGQRNPVHTIAFSLCKTHFNNIRWPCVLHYVHLSDEFFASITILISEIFFLALRELLMNKQEQAGPCGTLNPTFLLHVPYFS